MLEQVEIQPLLLLRFTAEIVFMLTQPFDHVGPVNEGIITVGGIYSYQDAKDNMDGCYPWMNCSSIRRTWSLTMALNLLAFILASDGFNEPQPWQKKHTPRCKGAAKTVHSWKQQPFKPVDIYRCVPHAALATLLSTRGWLMTQGHVNFSHYLQMCMWGVIKGLCSKKQPFDPARTCLLTSLLATR